VTPTPYTPNPQEINGQREFASLQFLRLVSPHCARVQKFSGEHLLILLQDFPQFCNELELGISRHWLLFPKDRLLFFSMVLCSPLAPEKIFASAEVLPRPRILQRIGRDRLLASWPIGEHHKLSSARRFAAEFLPKLIARNFGETVMFWPWPDYRFLPIPVGGELLLTGSRASITPFLQRQFRELSTAGGGR
jgi:hypothetical protein